MSKTQKDDLLEDIESCHQQLQDVETHLSNTESKAVKYMNKRRYYKLLKNIDLVGVNVAVDGQECWVMLMKDLF